MICGWRYPLGGECQARATIPVRSRVTKEIVWRCLNHAMADVDGGQSQYVPWDDIRSEP